jgi:ubiquinone/menaquinone biosynthesis C-methylase UbiE
VLPFGEDVTVDEAERIRHEYAHREATLGEYYSATAPANVFRVQSLQRNLLEMLTRSHVLPLAPKKILDVGCGAGDWLLDFERWGALRKNLAGIDLIPTRTRRAHERLCSCRDESGCVNVEGADIREGDASSLPWHNGSFDIVCQSLVFSSILDHRMRASVAREMARVLAPGGAIIWYDFFVNNPRNPRVSGVGRREMAALFADFSIDRRRITLLPPLARRLVPRSRLASEMLEHIRVLNTHVLAILRRG